MVNTINKIIQLCCLWLLANTLCACLDDESYLQSLDSGLQSTIDAGTFWEYDTEDVLDGGYLDWLNGDEKMAQGAVESYVTDTDHFGYMNARCFECHGFGNPFEPLNHDPRMQTWVWSCSRGFPGTACHGHDINGANLYNHNGLESFKGCTQDECHDTYNTIKDFENHGFMKAPDAFCNACHDYYWEDWPEGPIFERHN